MSVCSSSLGLQRIQMLASLFRALAECVSYAGAVAILVSVEACALSITIKALMN